MTDEKEYMKLSIGKQYYSTHPYAYRSGDVFEIVSVTYDTRYSRYCYIVRFGDGELDAMPVTDPSMIVIPVTKL